MNITYFKWDEDFKTGNPKIDAQHFGLVEMINSLLQISLNIESLDIEAVYELQHKLEAYVITHFATEEDLMQRYEVDSEFEKEHKIIHKEFVNKVKVFFSESDNYNNQRKLGDFVQYLIRWLAYHVLNTDKSLVRQIDNIVKEKMSPEDAYLMEKQASENSTEPLLKALKVLYHLVSEKNKEIELKNFELEKKVKERTRELERVNKKLEELSIRDSLTGLLNRRYVMSEIERFIYEWERYHVEFSILFIDVDKFKMVNDQYGHESGDRVLIWIAEYLKNNIRKTDIICRLGGDEFVVMCPHTSNDVALAVGKKLIEISKDENLKDLELWEPSISIGVTTVNHNNKSASDLLQKADTAMYKSKLSGGGKVTIR